MKTVKQGTRKKERIQKKRETNGEYDKEEKKKELKKKNEAVKR